MNTTLRTAIGIAVATLLAQPLAGCSGASSALPMAPGPAPAGASAPAMGSAGIHSAGASIQPAKGTTQLLYVADNENNRIFIYNAAVKNSSPIGTITSGISGPNGIAVDKSGDLWVANTYAQTVTEYAPNSTTPKLTLSTGLNQPFDVKVDGFGDVFVANLATGPSTSNYIAEFVPGVTEPVLMLPIAQGEELSGLAIANPTVSSESLYALQFGGNPDYGYVGNLLKCNLLGSNPQCLPQPKFSFGETGGIAVAQSSIGSKPLKLLVVDQYVPGYDIITVGKSTKQIVTGGTPEFITLNSTGKDVFVSDRFYGRVDEYTYPAGKLVTTFQTSGAQIYGVATSPSGSYH
jgi:hypothetical protein